METARIGQDLVSKLSGLVAGEPLAPSAHMELLLLGQQLSAALATERAEQQLREAQAEQRRKMESAQQEVQRCIASAEADAGKAQATAALAKVAALEEELEVLMSFSRDRIEALYAKRLASLEQTEANLAAHAAAAPGPGQDPRVAALVLEQTEAIRQSTAAAIARTRESLRKVRGAILAP